MPLLRRVVVSCTVRSADEMNQSRTVFDIRSFNNTHPFSAELSNMLLRFKSFGFCTQMQGKTAYRLFSMINSFRP